MAPAARFFMLDKGTSMEYGARELRRTIHRHLTQPLAAMVADGDVAPGAIVAVDLQEEGDQLTLVATGGKPRPEMAAVTVLAVDDNEALLGWIERVLTSEGHKVMITPSSEGARRRVMEAVPDILLFDHILPDGEGVGLAVELIKEFENVRAVVMSGATLDEEEMLLCQRYEIPFLQKPFVAEELLSALHAIFLSGGTSRSATA